LGRIRIKVLIKKVSSQNQAKLGRREDFLFL